MTHKHTAFRVWLQRMWQEHQDEMLEITGRRCDYTAQDYFRKYKWWLKTVYMKGHENA